MSKIIEEYAKMLLSSDNEKLQEVELFSLSTLGAVYTTTMILRYASDMYQKFLTKAGKECSQLTGASHNLCVVNFKIRGLQQQINFLHNKINQCNKSRNPESCKLKINEKLKVLQDKMRDLQKHKQIFVKKENEEKRRNIVGGA